MDWIAKLSTAPTRRDLKKEILKRTETDATKATEVHTQNTHLPPCFEDIEDIEYTISHPEKAVNLRLLEGGKSKMSNRHNKTWLDDHRVELLAAGFTERDIKGEGWFMGLADLTLWDKPGLQVELRGDQLCFTWHSGHGLIQQTAQPTPWRQETQS